MITKSLAGVAAGVLLIGGGALATAQANPSTTTIQAASVQRTASASSTAVGFGPGYPASVVTNTVLRVQSPVRVGSSHRARISVSAGATKTTPRGTVTVSVAGKSRSTTLVDGVAVVTMPTVTKPGSYTAHASYHPKSGSQWKRSSDSAPYRVTRR
jgi:hypothetical protein